MSFPFPLYASMSTKPQMSAPTIGMPHMLDARMLATLSAKDWKLAPLSPVQWPVKRPAPGKVDLQSRGSEEFSQ